MRLAQQAEGQTLAQERHIKHVVFAMPDVLGVVKLPAKSQFPAKHRLQETQIQPGFGIGLQQPLQMQPRHLTRGRKLARGSFICGEVEQHGQIGHDIQRLGLGHGSEPDQPIGSIGIVGIQSGNPVSARGAGVLCSAQERDLGMARGRKAAAFQAE